MTMKSKISLSSKNKKFLNPKVSRIEPVQYQANQKQILPYQSSNASLILQGNNAIRSQVLPEAKKDFQNQKSFSRLKSPTSKQIGENNSFIYRTPIRINKSSLKPQHQISTTAKDSHSSDLYSQLSVLSSAKKLKDLRCTEAESVQDDASEAESLLQPVQRGKKNLEHLISDRSSFEESQN